MSYQREVPGDEDLVDIKGYEKLYAVTRSGKVWSHPKNGKEGRWLTGAVIKKKPGQNQGGKGYVMVQFWDSGKYLGSTGIHRLVAETFIPNPNNKPQVNHIDGDKLNNDISNLEWVTAKENMDHAVRTGLKIGLKGELSNNSKLTELQVIDSRRRFLNGETQTSIARRYGVGATTMSHVLNGRSWRHLLDEYTPADIYGHGDDKWDEHVDIEVAFLPQIKTPIEVPFEQIKSMQTVGNIEPPKDVLDEVLTNVSGGDVTSHDIKEAKQAIQAHIKEQVNIAKICRDCSKNLKCEECERLWQT